MNDTESHISKILTYKFKWHYEINDTQIILSFKMVEENLFPAKFVEITEII